MARVLRGGRGPSTHDDDEALSAHARRPGDAAGPVHERPAESAVDVLVGGGVPRRVARDGGGARAALAPDGNLDATAGGPASSI